MVKKESLYAKHSKMTYQQRRAKGDVSITIWLNSEEIKALDRLTEKAEKVVLDVTGMLITMSRTGNVKNILRAAIMKGDE